ncbi:MAG: transposase [Sodalis sp. (in: enterobacteria)]
MPLNTYRETTKLTTAIHLSRLNAAMLFNEALNRHSFLSYAKETLVTKLISENLVIIDNLITYKVDSAREAIVIKEKILLYLLPYSPDLNPSYIAFTKMKHWLKNMQQEPLIRCDMQALNLLS